MHLLTNVWPLKVPYTRAAGESNAFVSVSSNSSRLAKAFLQTSESERPAHIGRDSPRWGLARIDHFLNYSPTTQH